MSTPTAISQRGLDLIKSFEGYHTRQPDGSCKAYLDRLAKPNIWTIGYGLTEGVYEGMCLSAEDAEAALRRELSRHEAAVVRLVTVDISQNQFDALVSFSYNCGTGALGRSTLLKRLNAGDYKGAARGFGMWVKAGGKTWPGLVRRRKAEAELFGIETVLLGEPPAPLPVPDMPQRVDDPQPEKAVKSSRKWWLLEWLKGLFATGTVGTVGFASAENVQGAKTYLDTITGFAQSYGVTLLIVLGVGGFVMSQVVQIYMQQDLEDGRYTPSGDA